MVYPNVPFDPENAELLLSLVSTLADLPAPQQRLVLAYVQGLCDGYTLHWAHQTEPHVPSEPLAKT